MGQVNCNAAQGKVRYERVIDGKEGFKFQRKSQETNSVNKFKIF